MKGRWPGHKPEAAGSGGGRGWLAGAGTSTRELTRAAASALQASSRLRACRGVGAAAPLTAHPTWANRTLPTHPPTDCPPCPQGVWVRHALVPSLRALPGMAEKLEKGCMVRRRWGRAKL